MVIVMATCECQKPIWLATKLSVCWGSGTAETPCVTPSPLGPGPPETPCSPPLPRGPALKSRHCRDPLSFTTASGTDKGSVSRGLSD